MLCVFGQKDRLFVSNGDHILKATKAIIIKEDNADYYIEIEAPLGEIKWLQEGRIIAADTPWGRQGFRLTNPKIKTNKVSVKGRHVYFDAERYVISDCSIVERNGNEALNQLNAATDQESPFTVTSDLVNTIGTTRIVRKTLREAVDEVLAQWGGHLERDNYHLILKENIGRDRGVVISYAKNLEDLTVEENWKNVATKIMPVGNDELKLPEEYLYGDLQYDIPYTKVVKIDQNLEADEYVNEEAYQAALINDLRKQGQAYLVAHATPECTYTIKASLQDIADVGDMIHVKHPKIPVDLLTRVTAVKWNCLTERYESVTFGTKPQKLSNINTSIKSAENKINIMYDKARDEFGKKLVEATGKIWRAMSDSHVIYDGDKILVVDKLPKEEAKNCILINAGGIGFSKTGINGEFSSAWTIDGTLDMGAVDVLNLTADMIKTGTLDASLVTIDNLIKAINEVTDEEKIHGSHVEINGKELNSVIQDMEKNKISVDKAVIETAIQYALSSSADAAPSAGWSEFLPAPQEGEYIWQRTVSTYGDETQKTSDPVCLSIAAAGKDGRGIVSVKSLYAVSVSDSEAPAEWEETAPVMSADSPYLWSYELITYSDETTSASEPRVIGIYGKGEDGVVYTLSVSPQLLNRTYEGELHPQSIIVNSLYRSGSDVVSHLYAGRYVVEESADGETYQTVYTSSADESGLSYQVVGSNTRLIKVSLYAAGESATGARKLLAQQSAAIVQDGTPSTLLTIRSTGGTVFHNGKGQIQLTAEGTIGSTVITDAAYQWYKDGEALEGETAATYQAAASTIGSQPAVYRCDMTYEGKTYTASITLENKIEFSVSETAPEDPAVNEVWLDKSEGGRILKYWNGTDWVAISDYKGELEQVRDEQSQLLQEASGIVLQHLESYSEKSELTELRESLLTQLSVLEGKIEMKFETANESTMQIGDALEVFKTLTQTFIQFGDAGMSIGKSDSPFKSVFTNDRLSFQQDGAEVAYISNNKLYITDAEIKGSLYLTNGDQRSRWYVDDKGSVCLQ